MKPKPTIATVAKQAGVAVSTVSRYLNGRYVSGEVRERLAQVVAELGYVPSATARNLSIGRKGCIGVVVDSSQDPWFMQLLAGIEDEISIRDSSLMLASLALNGRYDPGVVLGWIRDHRVDGLIFARSRRRERALLQAVANAKLPLVVIAPDETVAHAHLLRCDNIGAGRAVAYHLAKLGHRQIAFAGGPRQSLDSQHRLRGLTEGLEDHGIQLEEKWVTFCGSYQAEAGMEWAEQFLKKPPQVSAAVLANDALALGFMRVALQKGIRIPSDLSVVGFDNVPEGALLWPGLSTMAQPMREMGQTACVKLFEAIAGSGAISTVEYPMVLVQRESTGPAKHPARTGSHAALANSGAM